MAHHEQLWCGEMFFKVCSRKIHHTEGELVSTGATGKPESLLWI